MTEGETGIPPTEQGEAPPKIEEHERFGAKVREIITPGEAMPDIEFSEITYETQGGKVISINQLLPTKDWSIAVNPLGKMDCQPGPQWIRYGRAMLAEKGFFLRLLHELGHAHIDERRTLEENQASSGSRAIHDKFKPPFFSEFTSKFARAYMKIEAENPEKAEAEAVWDETLANFSNHPSYGEFIKANKAVIKEERDAWAWGLRKFRQLRRQGIDLEPELRTRRDLLRGIRKALETYEPDSIGQIVGVEHPWQ